MANFSVPNVTIPFDMLTNEQREAIYLIMTGDGFRNPLKEKIIKAKEIVVNEINLVSNIQIHPYSQTLLTEQQITLVQYNLNTIMFWLNALELHSDKLSGNESEYVGDLMQRLSVAGLYTKTMKSITGMDKEQYSLIFGSLTSLGESVINNLSKLTFCEGSSNFCEIDTNDSGVEGIAHAIEVYPSTVDSMNQCLFPKIIERLKNLIDADEENFCKARRLIESYSYGTKIIESLENDPIFGEAIKNVFATPQLKQALIAIREAQQNINLATADEEQTTDKFFPEFELGSTLDCLVEDQLIHYGIQGVTGAGGGVGMTGSPGLPGPVGDCNCGEPSGGGGGAGGAPANCDCSQGGDGVGCCCVCDGYGVQATEFQCGHYGGVWYGIGSDCSQVPCEPSGDCVGDADCSIGEICCGAQCIEECDLGGCPPCPVCAEGYSQCGSQCCQDAVPELDIIGQLCCGDTCKTPCVDYVGVLGCPDCQGECCPEFTSCCGGDACCPDGSCCNGECCEAGTQVTTCTGGGTDCKCCPIGTDFTSKCCNGECCSQDLTSGEWQTCCGAAGCCDPAKCCNGICCSEGEVCCQDDSGVYECIPEGNQCNCPDGSYECDELGDGGLLCCADGQSCCTKSDGTKYCCDGECCDDECCLGKCMDNQCCGVIEGWDYGGEPEPNCTACQHPNGDVFMCFCQEPNGDPDVGCVTCPHCPCVGDIMVPVCQGNFNYGVNCFCPSGFVFDYDFCECNCPTTQNTQPCESPWSNPGDANEDDPCWDGGGYCCPDDKPNCCGHQAGEKICYQGGLGGHQCCDAMDVGGGPTNIECQDDTGNWLCGTDFNDLCCGGWRWNGPASADEGWTTVGLCCDNSEQYCAKLPNAELYNSSNELIWRGVYACCELEGNSVDGGPLFDCEPEEDGDSVCRTCPCDQIQIITSADEAVCCPEGNNEACVDDDGTVHCWDRVELPHAMCCSSQHTNEIIWGEFGCCNTQNQYASWIQWNEGFPITRAFAGTGRDGCPCGCEHSVGGGEYDSTLPTGESSCQVACPLVQAGVGIGHALIDHNCGPLDQATPGHVCECRKFNPIHDCPNEITGNFHECCCPEGSDAEGLAKTHVLMCDGEIHEHWNSCGEEDIPGELWCLDCGFDEEDCNICCYNEPGIHCGRMSRNDVVCSHQCLGAVNFGGVYSCGGDPGGFGQEGGFCSHGCENGMPSCTGNKPKYSGEPCNSDCQECEEVVAAGARFSPPASGSCWFDNRCSSFEGIDDGIRMNMGGNEKLIKSPQEMCREIGGVWHSDKSCDEFVPKNIREAEEANLNYNLISSQTEERRRNALERGWGKLLEKHPTKTIDDIIGARKKYTPVFDESGKLIKTKVELVFDSGPTGGQSELSTPTTVTQTVTNYPIQFQLVNFVADDKRKTEFRDISSPKDTKSKISLAELKNEKELGKPGAEFSNAETIIVNGELTAAITNDGTIGEGLLISFVSGSNIKLTTNESNNIIKISLDDIYLDEIVDVSDNEPNFGDVLQWRVGEGGSTGEWTPVSPNVGVTGPTGPIGGSDKQILFNQLGAASGSDNLKYDYETNTLDINSKVDFGSGFTFSGTANIQGNSIVEAEIKDYSETVHTIGNVTGSSLLVNVNNGNIQTFTKYVSDGGIVSGSFFNAGTGSVTMTLIMTDAGTGDGFTFPSAIWAGGNVPSYSASGTDIITFNTIDGGTSWYGFVGGLGFTG